MTSQYENKSHLKCFDKLYLLFVVDIHDIFGRIQVVYSVNQCKCYLGRTTFHFYVYVINTFVVQQIIIIIVFVKILTEYVMCNNQDVGKRISPTNTAA